MCAANGVPVNVEVDTDVAIGVIDGIEPLDVVPPIIVCPSANIPKSSHTPSAGALGAINIVPIGETATEPAGVPADTFSVYAECV